MDGSGEQTGGPTSTSTTGTSTGGLSHLPWTQIPPFRPGETDIHKYSRKLEFLAGLWPAEHLSLLAPRAAMLCEGSAFQRVMRVEASKLKANSVEGVKALVTALGGIWGKTSLEDRFERFERAVYSTVQRGDETHESYLARHDHQFESLLSSGVTMEQLRAYVLLRNSGLAAEDKKKLIIDSAGKLDYSEVVRSLKLLGSKFFQEVHAGTKNPARSRTYDINMTMEEEINVTTGAVHGQEESIFVSESDESFIEALAEEGDPDALICQQFEEAVLEVLQNDSETASCYLTYSEARKRLSDRNRNRGFWSPGPSQSGAKGFKGRGKGKFAPRNRRPLAARILESECRRCGQRGHWKAECPLRHSSNNTSSAGVPKENATFATMTMTPEHTHLDSDMIPMTEMDVPFHPECKVSDCQIHECFMMDSTRNQPVDMFQRFRHLPQRLKPLLQQRLKPNHSPQPVPKVPKPAETSSASDHQPEVACFASHGSFGVVDLGASQSVIGQRQLAQVLESLGPEIRKQIKETRCDTVFRFGNSSTVHCQKAMLIPLGRWYVKLCIVPSDTPFLLSNNMFRTLGAQIDTAADRIFLPGVNINMDLVLTEKKLYLLDFGKLVNLSFQQNSQNGGSEVPQLDNIMLAEGLSVNNVRIGNEESPGRVPSFPDSLIDNMHDPEHPGTRPPTTTVSPKLDPSETLSNVGCSIRDEGPRKSGGTIPPCDEPESSELGRARFHQDVADRTGTECDHVRRSQEGTDVREGSSGGSKLCDLVHQQVPAQSEIPTSSFPALCSGVRESSRGSAKDHTAQEPSHAQEPGAHDGEPLRGHASCHRPVGRRESNVGYDRGPTTAIELDGEPTEPAHFSSGSCPGTDRRSVAGVDPSSEGRARTVDPEHAHVSTECQPSEQHDLPAEICMNECIDVEFFQDCLMTNQIPDNPVFQEMWSYWKKRYNVDNAQQIQQHFSRPGIDLLEVYCSQDSQLTQQCLSQGLSAARFSLKQGDLSTITGRHVLYDTLWRLRPKHIWVAPTCKPWCCWNRLNAAKSEALAARIQQERQSENVHLLLCDALLRLQLWRRDECHFHLEQPQGSELVHQREMYLVNQHTLRSLCDMCTAGKLSHPETGNWLRKRTQILTTSQIMHHTLERLM